MSLSGDKRCLSVIVVLMLIAVVLVYSILVAGRTIETSRSSKGYQKNNPVITEDKVMVIAALLFYADFLNQQRVKEKQQKQRNYAGWQSAKGGEQNE
jgi:uncharacterized protein YneF (UPF0154 family)